METTQPKTQQAIGFSDDAPALAWRTIEVPTPTGHDILVQVEAISANPIDAKQRQTANPDFRILGFDAAGTVVAVGEEVTMFQPGDVVMYAGSVQRPGSHQQYQLVDERIVAQKPQSLDFAQAASLPLTMLTAWEGLFDQLQLTEQSQGRLLVVGATGGVGMAVVQLVAHYCPKVHIIATASSPERATAVRELGAHEVVNHHEDIAAQLDGEVDWIYTAFSAGQAELYAQILRTRGHIVGIDNGPESFLPLKLKAISWHWESMFARPVYYPADMDEQHRILRTVAALIDAGELALRPVENLGTITPENLELALQKMTEFHQLGKVVLAGWPQ